MSILVADEKARNSDDYLYSMVCQTKLNERGIDANRIHFMAVMTRRKELGLPPYETVRRTRQKIQSQFPELRGNAKVEAMRMAKEEEFRAYARGVGV